MQIQIEHLTKKIKGVTVLDDITYSFQGGRIYGLSGKNGCGKTMLMRSIAGLIYPTSGKIMIDGEILGKDISFPKSMGLLIENPVFLRDYTGFENLRLLAGIQGGISDDEIREVLEKVGLLPDDKRKYYKYSLGMDVVKKNLEKVGGKLYVDSKFGEGSVFTIRIPLSLSILDVLSVDVGGENFSLPVSAVSEAFSCKAESFITDPEGNEFIMLREKCLPLIRMSDHFDIPNAEKDVTKGIMLCCKDGGKEAVLMADRITVDQQVVVKPFSPLLDAYPLKESGMAGCSVLGDGSITIILDMKEFLGNYDFRKGEQRCQNRI